MSWAPSAMDGRDRDRRSDYRQSALPQLKPYPPDRYRPDCETCHAFENLFICCYKFNEQANGLFIHFNACQRTLDISNSGKSKISRIPD